MPPQRYNIRTYGILMDKQGKLLVTDERRWGTEMTKFPGGGHILGEGLREAVIREMKEELNAEVEVISFFYINDFLQVSAFNKEEQLLSAYFLLRPATILNLEIAGKKFDFPGGKADAQTFRWLPASAIHEDEFTFPVDKHVAGLIRKNLDAVLRLSGDHDLTCG